MSQHSVSTLGNHQVSAPHGEPSARGLGISNNIVRPGFVIIYAAELGE